MNQKRNHEFSFIIQLIATLYLQVVKLFARHFQTQEPMPERMLQKLCASKNMFPASELQIQVFYSMLDQVYHSRELTSCSTDILKDIQSKYYGLPYVENTVGVSRKYFIRVTMRNPTVSLDVSCYFTELGSIRSSPVIRT